MNLHFITSQNENYYSTFFCFLPIKSIHRWRHSCKMVGQTSNQIKLKKKKKISFNNFAIESRWIRKLCMGKVDRGTVRYNNKLIYFPVPHLSRFQTRRFYEKISVELKCYTMIIFIYRPNLEIIICRWIVITNYMPG